MSDRSEREERIIELFKEDGYEGMDVLNMAISLGKLTEEELSDLEGFVIFSQSKGERMGHITSTLGHDIHGIPKHRDVPEQGFCPRTIGAAKYKLKEAVNG